MSTNNKDLRNLWWVVRIILAAIIILMVSGWFVSIPDWTDALYADLHAGNTVRRIIGTVIFCFGAILLMGFVDLFNVVNDFRGQHNLGKKKDAVAMHVILGNGAIIALGLILMIS